MGWVEEEIFYMWTVAAKTIRSTGWWLPPLLVVTLLSEPSAAQADRCPDRSDSFDGRHDRMTCMVDSESHTAVFLHLEIRWQLVVWTTTLVSLQIRPPRWVRPPPLSATPATRS